jgi:hypothetical protein
MKRADLMRKTTKEVFDEALTLSKAEREQLMLLLANHDNPGWDSPEIEQAWREECDRRVEAMDRGDMELLPADEVFRRARARLAG